MMDKDHIAILRDALDKKDISIWNNWRKENLDVIPSLRGADLRNANLSNANLSGAYLTNANLSEANLRNAYLSHASLFNADLSHANLTNAYLTNANLSRAIGICSISNVGVNGRLVVSNIRDNVIWIYAGCFSGTTKDARMKLLSYGDANGKASYHAALIYFETVMSQYLSEQLEAVQ